MIKPYLLQTLKELALLGAIKNRIELSSQELAKQLETSQQTSSRYLLELDHQALIQRELGIKKQLIQITPKGSERLTKEYTDYQQIFELTQQVIFQGTVVSGMGEGKYYTEQTGYINQFMDKLGFVPYPGTLNIEIPYIERNKLRLIKNYGGIEIQSFKTHHRTFGAVLCFPSKIQHIQTAIVLPKRSHYSNILEVISPVYLRKNLDVKDGDTIEITVFVHPKNENEP